MSISATCLNVLALYHGPFFYSFRLVPIVLLYARELGNQSAMNASVWPPIKGPLFFLLLYNYFLSTIAALSGKAFWKRSKLIVEHFLFACAAAAAAAVLLLSLLGVIIGASLSTNQYIWPSSPALLFRICF